jgi:hypothetical protein
LGKAAVLTPAGGFQLANLQLANQGEENHLLLHRMALQFFPHGPEGFGQGLQHISMAFGMFGQDFRQHGVQARQLRLQIGVVSGRDVVDKGTQPCRQPIGGRGGLLRGVLDAIDHGRRVEALGRARVAQGSLAAAAEIGAQLLEDAH